MRTIKFRGQRKYNGKWIYGSLIYFKESYYIQESGEGESFIYPMNVEVIPETIGQFTGLFDKDGKEIYEGDIVKSCYGTINYSVKWDSDLASWVAINQKEQAWIDAYEWNEYCEIIGNIHERSEV